MGTLPPIPQHARFGSDQLRSLHAFCWCGHGNYSMLPFGKSQYLNLLANLAQAFPVLCRILTELKLLQTPVGVIVLSAGVGNDVVGWILLALCVALVNAGSGLTALWVLLVCFGYTVFLFLVVKPAFTMLLRRTGSLDKGPSQGMVATTLLMALASAFFTGIIGVHPIFGAFLIGLICPHEGGFAVKITEKVEDLVSAILLPLYFALSGLSTNLGLLNSGITWGYVVGVISVAFFAKVSGGTIAARLNGRVWRESFTIGCLMSCKGLVELIVLNIGLQAKILSPTTFTIFVVMALVTTFATTPLVASLYPRWYQIKLEAWKRGEVDWDDNSTTNNDYSGDNFSKSVEGSFVSVPKTTEISKLVAYLRLDSMPGVMTIISLLAQNENMPVSARIHPSRQQTNAKVTSSTQVSGKRPVQVTGIRLVELTDRDSSVMKVAEEDSLTARDPIVNTFRTFGKLNHMSVNGAVVVAPEATFASSLKEKATEASADLVLVPWSGSGSMVDLTSGEPESDVARFANSNYSSFVSSTMTYNTYNIAIFVDRSFGQLPQDSSRPRDRTVSAASIYDTLAQPTMPSADQGHHIFLPFFGSADDKVALRFVLQLAQNSAVTATIVHFELAENDPLRETASHPIAEDAKTSFNTTTKSLELLRGEGAFFQTMRDSLPASAASRVVFETCTTSDPIEGTLARASTEVGRNPMNSRDLVVLGRNWELSSRLTSGTSLFSPTLGSEAQRALGVLADGVVKNGLDASLIVIKAGGK